MIYNKEETNKIITSIRNGWTPNFFSSVCTSVLASVKEALPVKEGNVVEVASWEPGRKALLPDTH